MIVRALVRQWSDFFFAPQSPTPIALYRILYGVLNIANLAILRPDWLTWYGPHAAMSIDTLRKLAPTGPRIALLSVLPQTEFAINAFFWVFILFATCLTVGYRTRLSSVVVYVCLVSMQDRNPYILNSGDTLLRVTGFFLMFAPAGAAMSIDRLLRIRRGTEGVAVPLHSPWAQRLIQIQTSVEYVSAFLWKTLGKTWWDGTAVYYVLRLDEFRRFPVPAVESLFVLRLATWSTLLTEFAAGLLVWFRRLRYPVILAVVFLHIGIEYAMNIPLFEWISISTLVTFIYPEDLSRAWAWIRNRTARRFGAPVSVVYDRTVPQSVRTANLLQVIDILGRLHFIDLRSAEATSTYPDPVVAAAGQSGVRIITPTGVRDGFAGLLSLANLIPVLWPLAPFAMLERRSKRTIGSATSGR